MTCAVWSQVFAFPKRNKFNQKKTKVEKKLKHQKKHSKIIQMSNIIKLFTFDATNTLIKFRVPPWVHYKNVVESYGFNTADDQIKNSLKLAFKVMYKEHPNFGKHSIQWQEWWKRVVKKTLNGLIPTTDAIDGIAVQLINDFRTAKCWEVSEGSLDLISELRKRGVILGIISNFDPRLRDVLKDLELLELFKFVLTSYDIGISKPDKRVFEYALQNLNVYREVTVAPHECVHVGDDLEADYHGARAAGWRSLLVNSHLKEPAPVPHHVFNDMKHLCIALTSDKLIYD